MDSNTRAFAVILGPDADPELVRNSIRLIPGVDTVSAQTDNGIADLRDTLAWYADEENYNDEHAPGCKSFLFDWTFDLGARARKALA